MVREEERVAGGTGVRSVFRKDGSRRQVGAAAGHRGPGA